MMDSKPDLARTALLLSIVVVPLAFQPLRFEPHEAFRAGLLALLVIIQLTVLLANSHRRGRPTCRPVGRTRRCAPTNDGSPTASLTAKNAEGAKKNKNENSASFALSAVQISALLWCAVLIASSLFALSPARALFGDVLRRMGLWTELALAAGVVVGARLRPAWAWRGFWFAGVVAAVFTLIQAAGWIPAFYAGASRVQGLLGLATYTGSFLALAAVWAVVGAWSEWISRSGDPAWSPEQGQTHRAAPAILWFIGVCLMIAALAVTATRGAALGLAAGLVTAILAWAAARQRRRVAVVMLALVAAGLWGVPAFNRLDLRDTPLSFLERVPLLERWNVGKDDESRALRERIWANALTLVRDWRVMIDMHGQPDRWSALRPLVGYGLENFEFPHRLLIDADLFARMKGQRIDRAHNLWLDTLVTTGWLGMLARAALIAVAWGAALYRMGLGGRGWWLLPLIGALVGGWLAGDRPLLPAALTAGALVGAWGWLGVRAILPRGRTRQASSLQHIDSAAGWVALAVMSAYVVDLQFGFATVTASWAFWLTVGMLTTEDSEELKVKSAKLKVEEGTPLLTFNFLLLTVVWLGRGLLWMWISLPLEVAALADMALLLVSLWLLVGRRASLPRSSRTALTTGLVVLALMAWWADNVADMLMRNPETQTRAAALRPWDGQTQAAAGARALDAGLNSTGSSAGRWFGLAKSYFERAAALNPFDAEYAFRLAVYYTALAPMTDERGHYQALAEQYFAAAARLAPEDTEIARVWEGFLQGES